MTINLCRGKRIIQIVLSFFVLPTAFSEVTDSFDEYYDDYQEYYDDIQSNHNYLGDKLDLGTLRGNNSGDSEINALSADGKIAGGRAEHNSGDTHAAIWFGHNWKDKLDLGTLSRDNSGHSEINALSAHGKIAGGRVFNNFDISHAAIWFGHNWEHKLDLGTLRRDNSGHSEIKALSSDGKIAGGQSYDYNSRIIRAVIWFGDNWKDKLDLGTVKSDNSGYSEIKALSADGKIAGGRAEHNSGDTHAAIWFGHNWKDKLDLGTLRRDNSGDSGINALSADGKIAGGQADHNSGDTHAAIWFGHNWKDKLDLGTLRRDNSGHSEIKALSSDGKIAGGWASNNSDSGTHAAIWFGHNWKHKLDLGTLKRDNSGTSQVTALSADGKTVAGISLTDSGEEHAFVSRIDDSGVAPNECQPAPVVASPAPQIVFVSIIDATNTRDTIAKLAKDTFSVMTFHQQLLTRLHQGCISNSSDWCWSIHANTSHAIMKNIVPGVNLGYGLTETLSLGGSIEHAFSRFFPDSHEMNGNNIGIGFYAYWHFPFSLGETYLRPAVSFSQYDLDIERSILSKTEGGKGNSKLSGLGASLQGGQNFIFNDRFSLGWHVGLRYSHLSRNAYQEENTVSFPVEYNEINYDNTTGFVGADVNVSVLPSLRWISGIEIAHTLKDNDLIYNAQADAIGKFSINADLTQTSSTLKTGLVYTLHKNLSLSVMTSLNQTNLSNKNWNTTLSMSGQF
ncbi:autotransporter domain-containing protein [Candidatus Williamhamiltonella defendens]|uniref:autotransporter domain-containing protein n=1 Tax=Candidatus Williamhamiltonella defendens TaxID=138072 RepID=UPI0020C720FB|nr:autotransporter domain-containing protein [Candidatus Hamiltonella defensa]